VRLDVQYQDDDEQATLLVISIWHAPTLERKILQQSTSVQQRVMMLLA
jgi:hypothetical protein